MEMALHDIQILGELAVGQLLDFNLKAQVNHHTWVRYSGVIDEEAARLIADRQVTGPVVVQVADDIIFQGYPLRSQVRHQNGYYTLAVECVSYSYLLAVKPNSRTFQNADDTYGDILRQVYEGAENASIITIDGKDKIAAPIVQYEETDWQFTLRMAGKSETVVIPNSVVDFPQVGFGVPARKVQVIPSRPVGREAGHLSGDCLRRERHARELSHADFYYYRLEDIGLFRLGDTVQYEGARLVVAEVLLETVGGAVKSQYLLAPRGSCTAPFRLNQRLFGLALTGTVIATTGGWVKLHLDIDRAQAVDTAAWFDFLPQQGNVMDCMPQVGTRGVLQFQSGQDDSGVVIHTRRANGAQCGDMADYNRRYFTTEFGKRLAMLPDALYYRGGDNLTELSDRSGIQVNSCGNIRIESEGDIAVHSKRRLRIRTHEKVYITKPGEESVIDMSGGEINAESPNTVIHSTGGRALPYPAYEGMPSMEMDRQLASMIAATVPVLGRTGEEK